MKISFHGHAYSSQVILFSVIAGEIESASAHFLSHTACLFRGELRGNILVDIRGIFQLRDLLIRWVR